MNYSIAFKILFSTFLFAVIFSGSPVISAQNDHLIAPVVVEINSEPIYETEMLYFLIGRHGQDVLADLIENSILAQKADEYGVTIAPDAAEIEMKKVYGEEKYKELEQAFNISKILSAVKSERLASRVYDAMIDKLVAENNLNISQEKALDYYLKNSDKWSRPAMVRFSIIVADSKEAIINAKKALDEGKSFAEVASEFSVDETTADNGGDLGDMYPRGFFRGPLKVLEDALFELPLNKYSDIISVEPNHFIVVPTKRLDKVEKKFPEVKDYIETQLLVEAVEPYVKTKLAEYRDNAKIEVHYPIFDTEDETDTNFVKVDTSKIPSTQKCLVYPVVVRVNGQDIGEQEMLFFLIGRYGENLLQELIENMAISQEAGKLGVEVEKTEPDKILKETYSADKLITLDKSFNMTRVKNAIYRELLAAKVFARKRELIAEEQGVSITEADAKQYYDNNIKRWEVPERVQFSIIVTEKENEMKSALDMINKGSSFGDAAKKYSIDKVTKDDGGDIGTLWPRGMFAGPFVKLEDEIFKLELNQMSDIMFIQDRFYTVMVTKKVPAETQPFEDVKQDIMDSLIAVKVYPLLQKWLIDVGNSMTIDIKYPIFDMESEITLKASEKLGLD